jgi:hypothetical protein
MSILSRRAPRVHTLPTSELDDDPCLNSNSVATAYQWGRQAGLRTEIDRAPSGYNEEEQLSFLAGLRDGRLARHPADCDLEWDYDDAAEGWSTSYDADLDGVRWELGA